MSTSSENSARRQWLVQYVTCDWSLQRPVIGPLSWLEELEAVCGWCNCNPSFACHTDDTYPSLLHNSVVQLTFQINPVTLPALPPGIAILGTRKSFSWLVFILFIYFLPVCDFFISWAGRSGSSRGVGGWSGISMTADQHLQLGRWSWNSLSSRGQLKSSREQLKSSREQLREEVQRQWRTMEVQRRWEKAKSQDNRGQKTVGDRLQILVTEGFPGSC
jgi:hypothetical protein